MDLPKSGANSGERKPMSVVEPITAVDLCCGAGGWACAARGLAISIVAAVDWWDMCCLTYARNHPTIEVIRRDVTEPEFLDWAAELRGSIDLVLGAIPCEWLSVRRNMNNRPKPTEIEQGRAVLDALLAAVRAIEPRWWCLEDVIQIRKELPPLTPYAVLDSRYWSGQRRKRCYVGRFPRPPRGNDKRVLADYMRPGPFRLGRRSIGRKLVRSRAFARDSAYATDPQRKCPTINAISSRRDPELVILDPIVGPRQMEFGEAARAQGFPDTYLFYGSPSDLWKMVGQAVQIDTGRAILEAVCRQTERGQGRVEKCTGSAELKG